MYYCKYIQERQALKSLVFQVGVYTWLPQIWGFGFGSSISRTKLFTNKQFHLFFFSRDEFGNNCLQIACINDSNNIAACLKSCCCKSQMKICKTSETIAIKHTFIGATCILPSISDWPTPTATPRYRWSRSLNNLHNALQDVMYLHTTTVH